MRKFIFCLLAGGSFLPLSVQARPYHLTTVRWIVETRNKITYDDRYVTLIGHVTRRIGDEEYWFTDGTGSVRLDSENFDLPVGRRLLIGGRIDQAYLGFGHLEVDVRKWSYAPLRRAASPAAATHRAPAPASAPATKPAVETAPTVQTSAAPAPTPAVETSKSPAVESTPPAPASAVDTNPAPSVPPPAPPPPETAPPAATGPSTTNDIPSFTPPPTNAASPLTPPADTH